MQLPGCLSSAQAACKRQNVTVTLMAHTQLASGKVVAHRFSAQRREGNQFSKITVTHLDTPTQVWHVSVPYLALPCHATLPPLHVPLLPEFGA